MKLRESFAGLVRTAVSSIAPRAHRDLSDGGLKSGKVLQGEPWSQGALMRACSKENYDYVKQRYKARGSEVPDAYRCSGKERRLGVGNFATTTRCFDVQLQRPVALKKTAEHAFLELSAEDARLLHSMGPSPYVAELLDYVLVKKARQFGASSRYAITVLELFGCDAGKLCARGHRMGDDGVRQVIRDWVAGVAHVHASGRPHGDIKEDNVLVDEQLCRGKVIDPRPADMTFDCHYFSDAINLHTLIGRILQAGGLLEPGMPGEQFYRELGKDARNLTLDTIRKHPYLAE